MMLLVNTVLTLPHVRYTVARAYVDYIFVIIISAKIYVSHILSIWLIYNYLFIIATRRMLVMLILDFLIYWFIDFSVVKTKIRYTCSGNGGYNLTKKLQHEHDKTLCFNGLSYLSFTFCVFFWRIQEKAVILHSETWFNRESLSLLSAHVRTRRL